MNTETPDFSVLTERLLSPYRLVSLVPGYLIDNDCAIRLIPSRGSEKLHLKYISPASLPTLDLAKTGIDPDLRPKRIEAEVSKRLQGRQFAIEPNFNFLCLMAVLPKLGALLGMKSGLLALEASNWFLRPPNFDPGRDIDKFITGFPQIGFSLKIDGEPMGGLDTTRPIRGFVGTVADFLMPWKSLDKDSAEAKALRAAMSFYQSTLEVGRREEDYKMYLAEKSQKWWFPYFGKKKRWEQSISQCKTDLAEAVSKAREALATLPA